MSERDVPPRHALPHEIVILRRARGMISFAE
ncbi:MAG: hypothetical protein QOG38_3090 [Hyphomicrobiales bacterium]|jgi:hypothetical protein|nr:hypothetical protein [Hyphomicrobiales bacterium]